MKLLIFKIASYILLVINGLLLILFSYVLLDRIFNKQESNEIESYDCLYYFSKTLYFVFITFRIFLLAFIFSIQTRFLIKHNLKKAMVRGLVFVLLILIFQGILKIDWC
jgi:hypothetical protein